MLDASQRVVFRESEFGFVRKMIDVGHVHQFRVVGKVASNGSFDRLVFGDEDPKGCLRVMDYPERYTAQFVENTNAAIFDTLTIPADYDTQDWQTMIRDHLSKRTSSRMRYFRLFLEDFSHRDALRQWVKSEYPDTAFKIEKPKIKDQNAAILPPTSELFTTLERRPAPTPSSIASHVSAWIETEFGQAMSEETVGRYLAIA
jgi:DNA repair exonuclease SbcCD nuclease subunit